MRRKAIYRDVCGYTFLRDYQNIANTTLYIVPTYLMQVRVEGQKDPIAEYEVVRYGVDDTIVNGNDPNGPIAPKPVQDLPGNYYPLKWDSQFESATRGTCPDDEQMGFRIIVDENDDKKNGRLIHIGPPNPHTQPHNLLEAMGTSGCYEICGPRKWPDLYKRVFKAAGLNPRRSMDRELYSLYRDGRLFIQIDPANAPSRLYDANKREDEKAFEETYPTSFPPKFNYPPPSPGSSAPDLLSRMYCALASGVATDACEGPPGECGTRDLAAPKSDGVKPRSDPLVLDLDGDGIETTAEGRSWAEGRAFFDHNADGFAERTGWVSGNDGLLVMDRNGDGIINNGRELFGSGTALNAGGTATNGFSALADLDSNKDGKIDANDALFSQLQIWQDTDEDGFSFPSELHTLQELGISSINLTPTAPGAGKDGQGNTQNRVGSFTWADGSSGQIAEYTFATNTAYTIATEWVDVPEDIQALPDLPGYGVVPRLQQAMARDTTGTLKSDVQSFIGATTRAGSESAMQDILYTWTGSAGVPFGSGRGGLSGPRVGVLSASVFRSYLRNCSIAGGIG